MVAAENSSSPALLPLDGPIKDGELKEEASTISSSSSSSEATPDHESIEDIILAPLDLDLLYAEKKEVEEVAKQAAAASSVYSKRKSEEDVSSLESKASTPSASHPQVRDGPSVGGKKGPALQGTLGAPWQQLLSLPPQQMLVIERMHSGARRFVVLDFGSPVLLTGQSLLEASVWPLGVAAPRSFTPFIIRLWSCFFCLHFLLHKASYVCQGYSGWLHLYDLNLRGVFRNLLNKAVLLPSSVISQGKHVVVFFFFCQSLPSFPNKKEMKRRMKRKEVLLKVTFSIKSY